MPQTAQYSYLLAMLHQDITELAQQALADLLARI